MQTARFPAWYAHLPIVGATDTLRDERHSALPSAHCGVRVRRGAATAQTNAWQPCTRPDDVATVVEEGHRQQRRVIGAVARHQLCHIEGMTLVVAWHTHKKHILGWSQLRLYKGDISRAQPSGERPPQLPESVDHRDTLSVLVYARLIEETAELFAPMRMA